MFVLQENTPTTDYYVGGAHVHLILKAARRRELYIDPGFAETMIAELSQLITDKDVQLMSLDVFDTVLLRNEKCELRRFLEIGDRLASGVPLAVASQLTGWDFLVARLMATKLSYTLSPPVKGCREGSLAEIHRGMCGLLGLDMATAEATLALEIEHEAQETTLNPLVPRLMDLAAQRGIGVILTSDMYMHGSHIERLLDRVVPGVLSGLRIFSSGDLKISKRTGLLFDYVCEQVALPAQQCLHVGDNLLSDFRMPRRCGWNAVYLPITDREAAALAEDERRLTAEAKNQGINIAEIR